LSQNNLKNKRLLVLNTSVLIKFNLFNLFKEYIKSSNSIVIIPNQVSLEEVFKTNQFLNKTYIKDSSKEIFDNFSLKHPQLGEGELGVLSLTKELKDKNYNIFPILDDKKARSIAKKYGFEVYGTLWIIIELYKNNLINKEDVISLIDRLPKEGFHLND